jgi:hypothetical protein
VPVRSWARRKGRRVGPICQRGSGRERAGRSTADEWGREVLREGAWCERVGHAGEGGPRWAKGGGGREREIEEARGPESAQL